jgi:hypothetical protein
MTRTERTVTTGRGPFFQSKMQFADDLRERRCVSLRVKSRVPAGFSRSFRETHELYREMQINEVGERDGGERKPVCLRWKSLFHSVRESELVYAFSF